jgi:hypothetical protein
MTYEGCSSLNAISLFLEVTIARKLLAYCTSKLPAFNASTKSGLSVDESNLSFCVKGQA